MQAGGETRKSTNGFRVLVRADRYVMRAVSHIDSRGVGMDDLQTWVFGSQPPAQFFSLLAILPQHACHTCAPLGMRTRFGPVAIEDQSLQRGHNRRSAPRRSATMSTIARTGAKLLFGQHAPGGCRPQ